jgi:hypothetical protein
LEFAVREARHRLLDEQGGLLVDSLTGYCRLGETSSDRRLKSRVRSFRQVYEI